MDTYLVCSNKKWNENLCENLKSQVKGNWLYINKKSDLTLNELLKIKPKYLFFPHWSSIIPKEIYNNFECVVFHMTDLPYGRGGSPLQNLIARRITETKISALKVNEGIDTGDIYLKEPLSLYGTAEEIFMRASLIIEKMIINIVNNNLQPEPQHGKPTLFKRRKPEESEISNLNDIENVYNFIRMLDAEGYPKAYIETKHFRFEFSRASLKSDKSIISDVRIFKKY